MELRYIINIILQSLLSFSLSTLSGGYPYIITCSHLRNNTACTSVDGKVTSCFVCACLHLRLFSIGPCRAVHPLHVCGGVYGQSGWHRNGAASIVSGEGGEEEEGERGGMGTGGRGRNCNSVHELCQERMREKEHPMCQVSILRVFQLLHVSSLVVHTID